MDNTLLDRLMKIAITGLFLAGMIFICICFFSHSFFMLSRDKKIFFHSQFVIIEPTQYNIIHHENILTTHHRYRSVYRRGIPAAHQPRSRIRLVHGSSPRPPAGTQLADQPL